PGLAALCVVLSCPGSTLRMVTDPLSRIGAHPPLRTPVTISPHAPRLPPSPPDVGAVLSAPTHLRQRLIFDDADHPDPSDFRC
ncbi:hypothetical protein, partial [Paramuribaculum intestinale]